MKDKSGILLGVSALLLAISVFMYMQGPSKKQLNEQYSLGYGAGKKAEQAKWSDPYLQLAKQTISDQIESQPTIERLISGDFEDLQISHVEKKGNDRIFLWLEAHWKDKAYTAGYLEFKKVSNYWFLITTRKTSDEAPSATKQLPGE